VKENKQKVMQTSQQPKFQSTSVTMYLGSRNPENIDMSYS